MGPMKLVIECGHQAKHMWCSDCREITDLDEILVILVEAGVLDSVPGDFAEPSG